MMKCASAKLCHVQHRAPPIFGRAAIRLGIGPHSSYYILAALQTDVVVERSSFQHSQIWCICTDAASTNIHVKLRREWLQNNLN